MCRETAAPGRSGTSPDPTSARGLATGIAVLTGTVAAATGAGRMLPLVGAPALGLLIGIAVRQAYEPSRVALKVFSFGSRTILQAAIVLLGATFGLGRVAAIGRTSLPLMLVTLLIALASTALIGRLLRVQQPLRMLVGVGTAICGASAIGAVAGVVVASETEIAYAISTIFAFNVVAVLLYPSLGHAIGLSQHAFGLWAGTAINDTSSVVAAASIYGHAASHVAVVTKLARATMIIPIVATLAAMEMRSGRTKRHQKLWRLIPGFILCFLAASALNTAGLVGPEAATQFTRTSAVLITVALASIGLSTRVADLRSTGIRPLLLGAALWAVVGASGLLLQQTL